MSLAANLSPLLVGVVGDGPAGSSQPALCDRAGAVTYGQLREDVLRVAAWLRRSGCSAGDRIAVCLPKTCLTVELILGILAADAVYVPLNHRLPVDALRRILHDLRPRMIVCARPFADTLLVETTGLGIATIGGNAPELGLELLGTSPGAVAAALPQPADLATLLYTSGSTGEPKGIMLSHGNLMSFVDWAASTFDISSADRAISHAPLHFDLSILDIFCTLSRHGSVHLIDETMARFPGTIRALLDEARISVWYSVPTALVQLQERDALKGVRSLRLVLFAGEVFPTPVLRRLMTSLPAPEYANLYGPTETNVCTYYRLPGPPVSDHDSLPIGRPCEHLQVDIRDEAGAPVKDGETGEICVAGPAVMQGYWQRPELTQASRLPGYPDSFRTGDYGSVRQDGMILFAGRRDQQVKVRGHRIELLALEAALRAHPEVRDAVVLTAPDGGTQTALIAFLVPRNGRVDPAVIREFIGKRLPPFYQPDRIDWLEEMPLTPTGKSDRTVLRSRAGNGGSRAAESAGPLSPSGRGSGEGVQRR
jgi:L-proline---[L-prolyl-carrier protein] ligase